MKNFTLLICSLFFYTWGEVFYVVVMIGSILINYLFGLLVHQALTEKQNNKRSKFIIFMGVGLNLLLLVSYKYANFIVDNLNIVIIQLGFAPVNLVPVHLPLGISFFTFQAITYVVDVYRGIVPAQRNIFSLGLYISLFPQLIAGPIVRYKQIVDQILRRTHSIELFSSGAQRFIYGMAKKMLIANPMGEVADPIFSLSSAELTMPLAWIGALAYTLQIYFDFSGYSDMAIGIGRMFGFRLKENFNYPYISTSVREFWRRWHISLSSFFKDYVYIPLGGNRAPYPRVYLNLLIVFILTGFWHGAEWNFLFWGLFHGLFLMCEHAGSFYRLQDAWKPLKHLYLLAVVVVGWVLFRSESLAQAVSYFGAMINIFNIKTTAFQFAQVLSHEAFYAFLAGMCLSVPIYPNLKKYVSDRFNYGSVEPTIITGVSRLALVSFLLLLSAVKIASSTYNPFIYFRF